MVKNFNKTISVRNQKYERGRRLKFKIHILIYGDNTVTVVRQVKFGTVQVIGIT
jgi:hypothetical protein